MSASTASLRATSTGEHRFYLWMAAAFIIVAFGGFAPTYWMPVMNGTCRSPPVMHVHGALMFLWTCFYFMQTALVANGRTSNHRTWGLFGIALFGAILSFIVVGSLAVLKHNEALGFVEAGRRFAAIPLSSWPLMAGLFWVAIANVKRPDVHKRVMILLMAALMTPAIARIFILLLAPPGAASAGPPPPFVAVPPSLVAELFVVAAMIYDWRTIGRPHKVYLIGLPVLLLHTMIEVPLAMSDAWMRFIVSFESLAG
jgi:hypothetical protein